MAALHVLSTTMRAPTLVSTWLALAGLLAPAVTSAEVRALDPLPRRADAYPPAAVELLARAAAIGNAARSCDGEACRSVASMLPIAGSLQSAIRSEHDRPMAVALTAMEVTALTLVALGVCELGAGGDAVRIGLRGPGLVMSARF